MSDDRARLRRNSLYQPQERDVEVIAVDPPLDHWSFSHRRDRVSLQKDGRPITTIEEWQIFAGPKSADQWKDDRSAKESARAWITAAPSIPPEIDTVLRSHDEVGRLREWHAEPEALVAFDEFPGPSNLDVLLVGSDEFGPIVVAVEAKADEEFGKRSRQVLSDARKRLDSSPTSKGVARFQQLLQSLFGGTESEDDLLDLRYQLMTASAAALAEAHRQSARRAVVVIHEFSTPLTADSKHRDNARDLDRFVSRVSGRDEHLEPDALLGPFDVPAYQGVSLYFGKAVVDLRSS